MINYIKKIGIKLNIDSDIGYTLLLRLWSTISGGLLVLMIPFFLSASEQGYYFTFSSFLGMQIFFELGFNFVITQMISHEMAKVSFVDGKLEGNRDAINRIYSLIYLLLKWYSIISILFFLIISYVGYYFFASKGTLETGSWLNAWILITFFSAINLFLSPLFSVLEGMGLVGRVAQIRLMQSILGYVVLACLFILDFRLNAIAAISGIGALLGLTLLLLQYSSILICPLKKIRKSNDYVSISWRREIFPFQWRIAISWLSGYFIFQLFNPLIFAHQGPQAAGKLGLSLAIYSAILALSISWVNAKTPTIARLISSQNKAELNPLFKKLVVKSSVINILCSIGFISFIYVIKKYYPSTSDRLADISVLIILACISAINHIIFCLAIYMRSHKQEPMLLNSIVTGFLVGISIYYVSSISVFDTILVYFLVLSFICLPWTLILFRKYYADK